MGQVNLYYYAISNVLFCLYVKCIFSLCLLPNWILSYCILNLKVLVNSCPSTSPLLSSVIIHSKYPQSLSFTFFILPLSPFLQPFIYILEISEYMPTDKISTAIVLRYLTFNATFIIQEDDER